MEKLSHFFSIRLPVDVAEQIKTRAEEKDQHFTTYLRYLIELGLRIEEMSNSPNPEKKLEALVYKSSLETTMLTRVLIRKQTELTDEEKQEILREASKTALETVQRYCGQDALDKIH